MNKLRLKIPTASMLSASMHIASTTTQAEESVSSNYITTEHGNDYSSTFTLTFNKPTSKSAAWREVKEGGPNWYISKKRKCKNSPHKVAKNYNFHGSIPTKNGDVITYSDSFSFPWKITRTGHIKFKGKIVFQKRPAGAS